MATRALSFAGVSLQSSSFSTSELSHESGQLSIDISPVGAYGGVITSSRVGTKDIPVSGWISAASADAMDTLIDTLKESIYGMLDNLDIDYAGSVRRYSAVCVGFEVKRGAQDITMVPVSLLFRALGCGRSLTQETDTYPGKTGTFSTGSVTFVGSAEPRPVISILINSQTALSSLKVENTITGQSLTITRAFANGDFIEIDSEGQSVSINGVAVDFIGVIPQFERGNNSITVTPTATAVNYDLEIAYYPLYY